MIRISILTITLLVTLFPRGVSAQSYYEKYQCDPWKACHNALANHRGGPQTLTGAVSSYFGTVGIMPENGIYAPRANYRRPQYRQPQQYQQPVYVQPQPPRVVYVQQPQTQAPEQAQYVIRTEAGQVRPMNAVQAQPVVQQAPQPVAVQQPAGALVQQTQGQLQQPIVVNIVMPTAVPSELSVHEAPQPVESNSIFAWWKIILGLAGAGFAYSVWSNRERGRRSLETMYTPEETR